MGEGFDSRSARLMNAGGQKPAIVMIAPRDMTTECLVEVLVKNFPDNDVCRHDDVSDITEDEAENMRLVLIYRPVPDRIRNVLERLRDSGTDHSTGIVVESIDEAEDIFNRMSGANLVDGVVPLDLRLDVFLAAVRLLAKGGEHFPSALLQRLRRGNGDSPVSRQRRSARSGQDGSPPSDPAAVALTTREIQILDLLCSGTQNKIIADRLRLSENTVKAHVRNIYKKMHVRNRTEAALRFFRNDFAASLRAKRKN